MMTILGLTFVAPSVVSAHHATVSGSTTCLDSQGASVLTWSVLYPDEQWSRNSGAMTITTNRASVSPNPLTRGNTATGSETVVWGNAQNIQITVYSVWANKQTSTDKFTIRKPESCPPVTTTTVPVTTAPTTTVAPTTTIPVEPTTTTIAATTTVPATSSTVGSTVPQVTTTTVTVLDTTVTSTTVTPTTSGPTTTVVGPGLPATGFRGTIAVVAALLVVAGIALVVSRRK